MTLTDKSDTIEAYQFLGGRTLRHIKISFAFLTSAAVLFTYGCSSAKNGVSDPEPVGEPIKINPHSIVFEWQPVYEQKLYEFASSEKFKSGIGGSMFDLRDLDGDAVPELIISPNSDFSTLCEIYTFSDGALKSIDTGGNGGGGEIGFIPDKDLVKFRYSGEEFEMGCYCSLGNGSFKEELRFYNNEKSLYSGTRMTYEINGEEVSLNEYESALEAYADAPELNIGRKYSFEPSTEDYALHYSESWGIVLSDNDRKLYRDVLMTHLDKADPSAAFELCDLNGDDFPELIFSEGDFDYASCRIYAIENGRVNEVNGGIGNNGKVSLDIDSKVVYAYATDGISFWSFKDGSLSNFSPSAAYMELGRKYLLDLDSITAAMR